MEGAASAVLEVRPAGALRWRMAEEIVLLWEPLREGRCVLVAVPPAAASGGGRRLLITCDGREPRLVFQNPGPFYMLGPDGVYEEKRGESGDGVRGERWASFEELLEEYDERAGG